MINQVSGLPYNDSGAFNAIADAIDMGVSMEEITLRIPPGKVAYVMRIPQLNCALNCAPIYVKVQLGSGALILGRSFHYSDYAEKEEDK